MRNMLLPSLANRIASSPFSRMQKRNLNLCMHLFIHPCIYRPVQNLSLMLPLTVPVQACSKTHPCVCVCVFFRLSSSLPFFQPQTSPPPLSPPSVLPPSSYHIISSSPHDTLFSDSSSTPNSARASARQRGTAAGAPSSDRGHPRCRRLYDRAPSQRRAARRSFPCTCAPAPRAC